MSKIKFKPYMFRATPQEADILRILKENVKDGSLAFLAISPKDGINEEAIFGVRADFFLEFIQFGGNNQYLNVENMLFSCKFTIQLDSKEVEWILFPIPKYEVPYFLKEIQGYIQLLNSGTNKIPNLKKKTYKVLTWVEEEETKEIEVKEDPESVIPIAVKSAESSPDEEDEFAGLRVI